MVIVQACRLLPGRLVRCSYRFRSSSCAYQVSGEYAMIEAAAANGWLDRERVVQSQSPESFEPALTSC